MGFPIQNDSGRKMSKLITLTKDQNSDLGQILNRGDPMHELYNIYVEVNRKSEKVESNRK